MQSVIVSHAVRMLISLPGIHDGKFALVPRRSGVELTLALVSAACTHVACVLETATTCKCHESVNVKKNRRSYSPCISSVIHSSVRLAAMGDMKQRGEYFNSSSDPAGLEA